MNTNYTHITMVLDRSGSMSNCWSDTKGGIETMIADQKKIPDKCTFSLFSFDDSVTKNLDFVALPEVDDELDKNIYPRGMTALYDAIGRAINETGAKLSALDEAERPGRVVLVIQTDGLENSSREFSADQIKKMIDVQTNTFSWQIQFIGANEESVVDANVRLGIKTENTAYYSTRNTTKTFDLVNQKMSMTRSVNYDNYLTANTMSFNSEEKEEIA